MTFVRRRGRRRPTRRLRCSARHRWQRRSSVASGRKRTYRVIASPRRSSSALLASLHGMQGSCAPRVGAPLQTAGREMLEELGLGVEVARVRQEAWRVEMSAGRPRRGRAGDSRRVRPPRRDRREVPPLHGRRAPRPDALRARAARRGRTAGNLSRELATDDDVDTQALWRCRQREARSTRRAIDGRRERLVREAIEILAPTDALLFSSERCWTWQRSSGSPDERRASGDARGGARLAHAKGSAVMAGARRVCRCARRRLSRS